MKLVIIDNYDSFTFNLYQMMQPLVVDPIVVVRNDKVSIDELIDSKPNGLILSPGPGHPAKAEDFGVCREVILRRKELACPILGVCLGHQGIAHYCGADIVQAPAIVHGKSSQVRQSSASPLFAGIPERFEAMRYHSLVADGETFPRELEVIARDVETDLVMAIQHTEEPIFGVQFHPESIGTPLGYKILENFVMLCRQEIPVPA